MIGRQDFFFVPALLLSILTLLFLPSSVSLSYFILCCSHARCLGKHSCMSSPFPIVILNSTCFFPTVQLQVNNVYSEQKTRNSCALVNICLYAKLTQYHVGMASSCDAVGANQGLLLCLMLKPRDCGFILCHYGLKV